VRRFNAALHSQQPAIEQAAERDGAPLAEQGAHRLPFGLASALSQHGTLKALLPGF
jgi:hypothetical protein